MHHGHLKRARSESGRSAAVPECRRHWERWANATRESRHCRLHRMAVTLARVHQGDVSRFTPEEVQAGSARSLGRVKKKKADKVC